MTYFRKKQVVIEAVRYTGKGFHISDVPQKFKDAVIILNPGSLPHSNKPHINTLEGPHYVSDGDWIIEGVKGEFYPCKPDIFEQTYEEVKSR